MLKIHNLQPSEPVVNGKDPNCKTFDVHSIFHTIQGEGVFCGTPAVFIRLAGCNLQCNGCDTEYTENRREMSVDHIMTLVNAHVSGSKTRLVVITGGEPFRQRNLSVLLHALTASNFYVQIETNGTLPPTEFIYNQNYSERRGVFIVVSPKTPRTNPKIWQNACCAKYVLHHLDYCEGDGLPKQVLGSAFNDWIARPPENFDCPIYIQPMDVKDENRNQRNLDACIDACMEHGHILQLQVHKIINME